MGTEKEDAPCTLAFGDVIEATHLQAMCCLVKAFRKNIGHMEFLKALQRVFSPAELAVYIGWLVV